ncbi:hypothetical protein TDB9533_03071 [Thalassocella blandensis]|nr:hypothetical protein TDB9533_03071 [Thalassocella blandensis]
MKDILGIACSGLCVLHCLALPLAVAVGLPIAGFSVFGGEWLHAVLGGVILLIAVIAFPSGYLKHKRFYPLGLALMGVAVLAMSLAGPLAELEKVEVYLTLLASGCLVAAHWYNRQLLKPGVSV